MADHVDIRLPKWPFILGDLLLLLVAAVVMHQSAWPVELGRAAVAFGAVAAGAWIAILPFLKDHNARIQAMESGVLTDTLGQLQNLEAIRDQIVRATSQWQSVQDYSANTVKAAKEITDRMEAEAKEFCVFLDKAGSIERDHLRLEVEKLRRGEGEWIQVIVRMFDHVYALHQAALRSEQPGLIAQLNQFQMACREAARRVGLVPFAPAPDEPFDPKFHQPAGEEPSGGDCPVSETLALGFSFQGRILRRAVVRQHTPGSEPTVLSDAPQTEPETSPASSSDADAEVNASTSNSPRQPQAELFT
jgi:hypothetical protein